MHSENLKLLSVIVRTILVDISVNPLT